jgi:hypothetical protein
MDQKMLVLALFLLSWLNSCVDAQVNPVPCPARLWSGAGVCVIKQKGQEFEGQMGRPRTKGVKNPQDGSPTTQLRGR